MKLSRHPVLSKATGNTKSLVFGSITCLIFLLRLEIRKPDWLRYIRAWPSSKSLHKNHQFKFRFISILCRLRYYKTEYNNMCQSTISSFQQGVSFSPLRFYITSSIRYTTRYPKSTLRIYLI